MTGRLRMPMITTRAAVLLAALVLGACVWPMDPVPTWDLRFSGSVSDAVNGAPLAGVRVSVWLVPPEEVGETAPFVTGETDSAGTFELRGTRRNRVIPAYATVRLDPAATSEFKGWTRGGFMHDVFTARRTSEDAVRYTGQFALEPAGS